jgi:hypothetical protein
MHERAATQVLPGAGLCVLAIAVLLVWGVPGSAQAASVVGPGGQISSCYLKKGKAKGSLRVVPAGKHCKKGEKKLTWNAQGPQGQTGGQGGTGGTGGTGDSGLQSQIDSLKSQISQLTSQLTQLTGQVTTLQGILAGVDNQDLLGALANVNSLCDETSSIVDYTGGAGDVFDALDLGLPLLNLGNLIPAPLSAYTCPQP